MRCDKCNSPVKPDIVFFGERLPQKFVETMDEISDEADLCLIMGTALAVSPFNTIPLHLKTNVPRVLFNMQNTKDTGGIDFTEGRRHKLFVEGKCDLTIRKLVEDCGW